MKVAIATEDGKTICSNFGIAEYYLVYDIQGNAIKVWKPDPRPISIIKKCNINA